MHLSIFRLEAARSNQISCIPAVTQPFEKHQINTSLSVIEKAVEICEREKRRKSCWKWCARAMRAPAKNQQEVACFKRLCILMRCVCVSAMPAMSRLILLRRMECSRLRLREGFLYAPRSNSIVHLVAAEMHLLSRFSRYCYRGCIICAWENEWNSWKQTTAARKDTESALARASPLWSALPCSHHTNATGQIQKKMNFLFLIL